MSPATLVADTPDQVLYHGGKGLKTRTMGVGVDKKPTFDRIPIIKFKLASSSSLEDRKAIASEVKKAFTEVGFMYALDHGIDADLQKRVTDITKEFFARPLEEKLKIHINNSPAISGYEPLLETRLDERTRGDLKEAFQMNHDPYEPEQNAPATLDLSTYPPGPLNQWPEKPADFRRTFYEYRNALLKFSRTLLNIIALSLDLPEDYFDHMLSFPMANLRALFYPTQLPTADDTIGIGAHADYSFFTFVNQLTDAPALEVLNSNGQWVSAPPIDGSLVVNVGDILERATNDRFLSTVHRVRNISGRERYSLAYFFAPSQDVMIRTLPGCLEKGETPKYDDIKAGDWSRARLLRARINHPAYLSTKNGEM